MKEQNEVPLYATLFYHVREQLGISWNEYVYLDMVYHLSKDGWCYKSLESTARDLGLHKNGVQKMKTRLVERGLLKKNIKGHVKSSVMYHSVVRSSQKPSHSVTNRNTQWYGSVTLSGTKNNIENNKEYKRNLKGKSSPAKERLRAMIKQKAQHGL